MRALFPLLMALSLIPINVNGLRDGNKRAGLLQFLRCLPNPPNIVCLQEVHGVSEAEACDWFRSSGFSVLASPGSPRSCGCAILYNPKLTLVASFCDASGRLLHCSFFFADVTFNVACLYAPNRNPARYQFFDYVLDVVYPYPPTILCGDFNTVFDRGLVRPGSDVDNLDPHNWRPITLLNVDYKIASRVMAGRLLKVIHFLVAEDQTYGVPGRFTGDGFSLLREVAHFASTSGSPACCHPVLGHGESVRSRR